MVVYHLSDDDGSYRVGINPTVGSARNRVMVWHEHQPILSGDANGVLLIAVADELMPSIRAV